MRTFLLLLSIISGILLPYGHNYAFLIRYLVMLMLFFSFMDLDIDKEIVTGKHFIILACTITISIILFFLLKLISFDVASAVFIAAIGPTAIAAPVIISIKKGNVKFVVFSLLLENVSVALLIPFLLPFLMGSDLNISVSQIVFPVFITLFVPFAAGQALKYLTPNIWNVLENWKGSTFYMLMMNIYIASSKASFYIRNESPDHYKLLILIGVFVAFTCALLFTLGRFIGGKEFKEEASYSLGQKNNGFTIWIALTYMNPLAIIGPVFYVLFQNIYISFDLYMHNRISK